MPHPGHGPARSVGWNRLPGTAALRDLGIIAGRFLAVIPVLGRGFRLAVAVTGVVPVVEKRNGSHSGCAPSPARAEPEPATIEIPGAKVPVEAATKPAGTEAAAVEAAAVEAA